MAEMWNPRCCSAGKTHEDSGLIPDLVQWVKDLAWLWLHNSNAMSVALKEKTNKKTNVFSQGSGSQKSEIQVLEGLVPVEDSENITSLLVPMMAGDSGVLGLEMHHHNLCLCLCHGLLPVSFCPHMTVL